MNEDRADQTVPPGDPGRSDAKDDSHEARGSDRRAGDGAGGDGAAGGEGADPGPAGMAPAAEGEGDGPRRRRRRRRRGRRAEGAVPGELPGQPSGQDGEPPIAGETAGEAGEASPDGTASPAQDDAAGGEKRRRRRRRRRERGEGAPDAPAAADSAEQPGAPGEGGGAASPAPADRARARERRREERDRAREARRERRVRDERPARDARPVRGPSQLAAFAVRSLAEMAERLLDVEGVDSLGRPRFLEIKLRVPLDVERDGNKASRQVVEQIVARVRDVREHEAALQPGAVYCFFSGSANEAHSRPPSPRQVFEGYGSTGRPTFADFMTVAVERRAEGVDRLANGEDLVVTCVSMGRVLRTQQLHEFGAESPVFRVLGQVDAGLYQLAGKDEKAAFSFQLLRAQTLDGAMRLRLHWVSGADLRDVADPMVPAILKRFQQRLDRESLRYQGLDAAGKAIDDEEFVLPFLQELAKQLAGRARRAAQRTEHANERVDERQRPTTKCWDDAREAGDDRILRDDEQDTLVVVGPKNRVHVFAADGLHVTSFVLTGAQVQRRVQEGRWHPAEPEDRGAFRLALRKRIGDGVAAPAPGSDA